MLLPLLVIATQLQTATPPRDTPSSKAVTGAISGRITERGSGRPLPRALVTLWVSGSARRLETLADAQGRYEFIGVEPGDYVLAAGPGELRSTHLPQVFGQDAPMFSAGPPRSSVQLKAGEVLHDLDILLTRALAIEGRVLDPTDEPMAGVEVTVMKPDGIPYPSMPGYSDDRGEFRVFGLATGRYHVCAIPQSRFETASSDTLRFVRTCHLTSVTESSAADVILETEDVTGIDIRVQRNGTYSISGSLLDAAGALADGAMIGAVRDDHSVSANAISRRGQFVLPGLTPGRYFLWASIGGPANPSDTRPPAREHEAAYALLDMEGTDVAGFTLTMSRGQKVAGRVLFEGGVPQAPGKLRMLVQMRLPQGPMSTIGSRPPFSAVDGDLNFELADVYRLPLIAGIQGLPDGWVVKSVRYDGRDIADVATDFGQARERRLEILVTNRVAKPSVRVTDDQGRSVTSYQVLLIPANPARWRSALWGASDVPSPEGVLKLGVILPGDYLIAAVTWDDYRVLIRDPSRIDGLATIAQKVTLAEGDSRTVEVHMIRLPAARQ